MTVRDRLRSTVLSVLSALAVLGVLAILAVLTVLKTIRVDGGDRSRRRRRRGFLSGVGGWCSTSISIRGGSLLCSPLSSMSTFLQKYA